MVFEALVSDLLNRFIGDYVENLDKSQLKIGIWGGNVVLENLRVKENALSEFDVPFKVKAGQIGKLTLKIPWKNLYSDAVVATLEGLYLLAVPGATGSQQKSCPYNAIKFDAVKEERYQQEVKQKELQRIEDALQRSARRASQSGDLLFSLEKVVYKEPQHVPKGIKKHKKPKKGLKKLKRHDNKAEKPPEEKKDSFVEKLVTQVIKNLQVKISSIHVRYEDDLSDPQRPLAMGVTLSELSLQTTDESWKSCILNEAAKIIYKLGRLESLCVYWNVSSPMFYRGSWENIVDQLKRGICGKDQELPHYHYIFRPIFASAKMCINPNAELELKTPKVKLHLEVQNISIEVTKTQYLSMLELLESVDCMVRNAPYRKFRPEESVHSDPKLWWRYALSCVLEGRRSRSWSWSHIKQHRENLKAYRGAYRAKIQNQNQNRPHPPTEKLIQDLENVLDVFNITLARQQAQMEVLRSGQKLLEKKVSGQKGGGFFGFFSRKLKKEEEVEESTEIKSSGLDELMTAEEKQKLYTAIGYSGSSHNLTLPKQFVAVVVVFQLCRASVTVREQRNVPEILKVETIDLSAKISQRPGAQALRVEACLQHWLVSGLRQGGGVPSLVASVGGAASLLSVVFELNPESDADQLLQVDCEPVEIIYDALTVNSLAEFFRTKNVNLEVLTSATLSKLEEIKEKTATGLSHIIETRKVVDLRVHLKPSLLLIPRSGFYGNASDLIILDFGSFRVNSVQQSVVTSSSSSLEEIIDRAYERYSVELRRVQVLYSRAGEVSSGEHILQPLDVTMTIAKSLVDNDHRMPRFKVSGELPLLHVKISDLKIQKVLDLLDSIPLPSVGSSPSTPTEREHMVPLMAEVRPPVLDLPPGLLNALEADSDDGSNGSADEDPQRSAVEELTDLHFNFEIKEVLLELTRQADQERTVLSLSVCQLGAEGRKRSFDLSVTSYLRRVTLDYCDLPGEGKKPLHLISSSEQQSSDLLKVEFTKADPCGPSFQTLFNNTEQMLKVEFASLDFLLHTRALLSTINYLNSVVPPQFTAGREADTRKRVEKPTPSWTVSTGAKDGGALLFRLHAALGCFHVEVCDDRRSIADIKVQGIHVAVAVQPKQTEVFARLRDIVVTDVNPKTVHRKAVSIIGDEVFSFKLLLLPGATEGRGYSDTKMADGKITLSLSCIKIIYQHQFMMALLRFVDNFQTAKAAVSAATAQAAAQAASSVRGLAHKSFRLSMDVKLKAPLIIIPQSSTSHNALVMDLGLITVGNSFSLLPAEGFGLPAVVDNMEVRLTQLKLSRTTLRTDSSQPDIEILQPINLELLITRNLAASWFTKIPGVQVQGVLQALNMSLGEEDLAVLMKILTENFGEGSEEHSRDGRAEAAAGKLECWEQVGSRQVEVPPVLGPTDNPVTVLLNFRVVEVALTLTRQLPLLRLHLAQLGVHTKVRQFDTSATAYISSITATCLEFKDEKGEPLCLISSSAQPGQDLLKVQYFKADRSGPNFSTVYKNTEQMINVAFSSLHLLLHTEALLSAINFLSAASSRKTPADSKSKMEDKTEPAKPTAVMSPADSDVIALKVRMTLGAFVIVVCDRSSNMADIKIQGMDGSLLVQGLHTQISARLRDVVVLNVDPKSIHRKAVSIVGDEVFSFSLSLTPNATEGAGYADTSRTDGRVKLNVGCIRVVYLHKFIVSLLNFTNNFQTAKAAVSAATAQAAAQAASSVRGLAHKSFRLSMDVKLKAPLIIIPQSSTSHNALVMDLGLITVGNSFSLLPAEGFGLPAVVDNMEVRLTQLKLSRSCLDPEQEQTSTELLEPVNLHLNIKRNLAASWFKDMVAVEVNGDLKPMKVELSQEDLAVLLRILVENVGEAGGVEAPAPKQQADLQSRGHEAPPTGEEKLPVSSDEEEDEGLETMRFSFSVESLGLVLYSHDPKQVSVQHQDSLRLGEFALRQLRASGRIRSSGGAEVTAVLGACTLDDQRRGVARATSRMVGRRDEVSSEPMVDVTLRQRAAQREVVVVLQKLYLCASVEFLMAVADFFLTALPQSQTSSSAPSEKLPLRATAEPRSDAKTASSGGTVVRAVVLDPEVVFVASLMEAGAPSLVVSFQCDVSLQADGGGGHSVRANLRRLKVLACPFIRDKEDTAVTTVLKPCSVALETKTHINQPMSGSVVVEEVIVKISPFILNTVMTITAAMATKQQEEKSEEARPDVSDLWTTMDVYRGDYWFLGVDSATEATESFRDHDGRRDGESFSAEVKVIQVTLESGLGHRTVPLLLAESSFSGSAKNWSSLLQLKADMTLEVNHFNEVHAVWEPLIERVDGGRRRWNLELEMKNNPVQDRSPVHGDDFVILPEPRTAITICSKDTMNITVSQCSLSVLQNLAKAFSEGAASSSGVSLKEKAPFTIRNALGIPLIVQHSATLRPVDRPAPGRLQELAEGQSLDLEHAVFQPSARGKLSALQRQESCLFHLTIVPSGYSEISSIAVDKPGRRLYNVRGPMLQEAVSVLVQIDAAEGNKVITVRSPLQIKNHFSMPFTILRYCAESRSLQSVGQAEPEAEFHVALESYRCQLFVRPAGGLHDRYGPSSTCVAWKEQVHHSAEVRSLLQCPAADGSLPLTVGTLAVPDDLRHIASHGEEDWDPAYVLHLHPVATLRNLLPYRVRYMVENSADSCELEEGGVSDLLGARGSEVVSVVLVGYQGRDWHGHVALQPEMPEFVGVALSGGGGLAVEVSVHAARTAGRLLLSLFSPYWIINRTARLLQYRADHMDIKHPADHRDVVLFSFRRRNLFSKNKLQLCVSTSSWSDGFSLDAVGSCGCVRCPANTMDFLVGVSISMSSFNLTRIVTMSPFYTLVNRSAFELEVGEAISQSSIRWHYISSAECLPLWPDSAAGKLCVRVVGSESNSKFFFFNRQDNGTLLSLDVCGGIIVDVNISDVSTVIRFSDYYDGAAPALLLNHTPWSTINYSQSGSASVLPLGPGEARRFSWEDPSGQRALSWSSMEHRGELDLLKDAVGQFTCDGLAQVHWVCFLDGRQRVLLFTEDVAVVTKARQAEELEQSQQEVKVSLQNLGLSLINNTNRQEIAYIGITSSGVVWEMKPKNRWKPLSQKNIDLLEKTFQSGGAAGWTRLETGLEVNLGGATMMMRQPLSCPLRRNFLSGIQVEFKQSLHQRSLRAQLHWLQVDNQLPGAIFPIVFHPVPPPKSIALDSEPKPFIDLSIITRFNQHSDVMQIKYFMALVQEMAVKVDQGFLAAILALFSPSAVPQADRQRSRLIDGDLKLLQAELTEASLTDASALSFFEHFHISPIKLHLSLSLGSSSEDAASEAAAIQSLNLLLKSIGATLTDVDDLIFKLAFFEVKYQFYRREMLMWAVVRHYSEQFLKQMYVLVLGLDVLGNPFGLIRGLSEGVEAFFYEPFQGAVQGPEEFAEGFAIGVRSLLGHTVGGAAGVVSRITGSVGKGLAAITMDKEYQQKRREEMNRTPKDFGESLAKGGKGLLKGVVGGVTGIVTKPVEGAKKEGAAGFFKGIGKGLVGAVARPTGGIVDMASSTFQGIQRVVESTEEVTRLRPVRVIREDGVVRPYDLTEAQGSDLLQRSQVQLFDGEVFRDHCGHPRHRKTTIITTNRRVLCVKEMDFVGHFSREWECLFENFLQPPAVEGTQLKIFCKEQQRLKLPKSQQSVRTVEFKDPNAAQKLQAAILDAQVAQQQHRMARQKSQRFLKLGKQ